jgi:8-oxo-dGTP pyrophosphatase MutT (NUDIX family)
MRLQKYKIYINGTPVFLASSTLEKDFPLPANKNQYFGHYLGKKKLITQYLDMLDKNKAAESVAIFANDLDALWAEFQSFFTVIEAAGGYVLNNNGQLLVFYRRGSWDLPKGKIDPGETPEQAAVREVQEETGLENVTIYQFALCTWHTYEHKGKRILKKTWWYEMHTSDEKLVPQTEEYIEKIMWVDPKPWIENEKEVYGSIRDVILTCLK